MTPERRRSRSASVCSMRNSASSSCPGMCCCARKARSACLPRSIAGQDPNTHSPSRIRCRHRVQVGTSPAAIAVSMAASSSFRTASSSASSALRSRDPSTPETRAGSGKPEAWSICGVVCPVRGVPSRAACRAPRAAPLRSLSMRIPVPPDPVSVGGSSYHRAVGQGRAYGHASWMRRPLRGPGAPVGQCGPAPADNGA